MYDAGYSHSDRPAYILMFQSGSDQSTTQQALDVTIYASSTAPCRPSPKMPGLCLLSCVISQWLDIIDEPLVTTSNLTLGVNECCGVKSHDCHIMCQSHTRGACHVCHYAFPHVTVIHADVPHKQM